MIDHLLSKGLNIELGIIILEKNPTQMEAEPIAIQARCSLVSSGTHFKEAPPNCTQSACTTMVMSMIMTKRLLLKKPLNTLSSSDFSFLALISLNTCKSTKMLKKRQ